MTGDQDYTCNIPPVPPYSAWQPVQTPTLRQMYAMAAMQALVERRGWAAYEPEAQISVVADAWAIADAMLKAEVGHE